MSAQWINGCAAALVCVALAPEARSELMPIHARPAPLMLLAQRETPLVAAQATEPARKGGDKAARNPATQAVPALQPPAAPAAPSPSTSAAEAPAPQAPAGAIGEFQPVLHAQGAKITTCMDTIVTESASVIDGAHTAISSWTTTSPDENVFVSIIGLSYANKSAPNAAAVILAAPVASNKCEGETVQVYPFAQPCSSIQASLIKEGRTVAMLRALPVVETKAGLRHVLLPSAGGGCVVIAVGLR